MAKELKLRRGTTAEHATFTGAEGEITVDTTKDTVVVHDGATAGGVPLAKEADIPTGALASLNEVNASTIADNSVGAAELNVPGNGTSGQFLSSDGDGSFSWADAGGGGLTGMQVFTSPGTWTNPGSVSTVKVTVFGGGGGAAGGDGGAVTGGTGGTSSFGAYVSATGGTGGRGGGVPIPASLQPGGAGSGGILNFNGETVWQGGSGAAGIGGSNYLSIGYVGRRLSPSIGTPDGYVAVKGGTWSPGAPYFPPAACPGADGGQAVDVIDVSAVPSVPVTVGAPGSKIVLTLPTTLIVVMVLQV